MDESRADWTLPPTANANVSTWFRSGERSSNRDDRRPQEYVCGLVRLCLRGADTRPDQGDPIKVRISFTRAALDGKERETVQDLLSGIPRPYCLIKPINR